MVHPITLTKEATIMEKSAVERSIWIKAPREQVWQALTEPEHLERWLLPGGIGARLKRDDGGKLSDADYEAVDSSLRAEAVEILHAIDTINER